MKKNIKIDAEELKIDAAFENFLLKKKSEGRAKDTLNSYRSQLQPFLSFCKSRKVSTVAQIDEPLIEKFKCQLLDRQDISQDTQAAYLRATKCFLYELMKEKEIEHFYIQLFPVPSKTFVSTYSDEEIKKVLNCAWSKSKDFTKLRDYTMMQVFLLTGARRSTICNMKVADVDFENDLIAFSHIKRDRTFQIRQVPMNADLKAVLANYMRKTKIAEQSEYLFPNVEGNPMRSDSVYNRIHLLFEAAGVEYRGCHEFRRTYATKTYAILEDTEKTRKLMLISDPRVLQRYINTDMGSLKKSAEQLTFVTQIKTPRPLRGSINKKGA